MNKEMKFFTDGTGKDILLKKLFRKNTEVKLSKKMLEAGWTISVSDNGIYEVTGSAGKRYTYSPGNDSWSCDMEEIKGRLKQDLELIRSGELSAEVTSSRLTALPHFKNASEPVRIICKEKWAKGKTVLHLGTGMDTKAKPDLIKSGALEIEDYDPNFFPDTSVLKKQYDVIIANYLFNILPPQERSDAYRPVKNCLKEDGTAYLTVQGIWPVENQYEILGKHEDGYIIKTGFNRTFRKGYSAEEFIGEIENEIDGKAELIKMIYSNSFVRWRKG